MCLHSSAFILLYLFVVSNTKELFIQLYYMYDFVNKCTINHIDLCYYFYLSTASRYGYLVNKLSNNIEIYCILNVKKIM